LVKLLRISLFLALFAMPKIVIADATKNIDIFEVQQLLKDLCYNPGPVDGLWGGKTERAVIRFYQDQSGNYDQTFDDQDLKNLRKAKQEQEKQSKACVGKSERAAEKVTEYKGWSIPQYVKPDPNLATLRHYFMKDYALISDPVIGWYKVKPASNSSNFIKNLRRSSLLKSEFETSGLLSYLYFEDGALVYDEKSPVHRLGDLYKDNTPFLSNSVGKSISSYVLGHAICKGYISGLDAKLDDWGIIENTLYHDQTLLDIVNMNAGDAKVVDDSTGLIGTDRWYNIHSIKSFAQRELVGSEAISKSSRKHHYNGLATNIFLNYIVHKTDYRFQNLLDEIFRDHVKVEHTVYFGKQLYARTDTGRIVRSSPVSPNEGVSTYGMFATRYDFLRIAKTMLDDWNSDNCVGQYLKSLVANKIPQKRFIEKHKGNRFSAKSYAGQFHLDYLGLENRNIFGMQGYGGQTIMVDFDNDRIISINSVHTDYDFEALVLKPLVRGKLE